MSIFSVNLSSVDAQLDNVKPLAKILLDTSGSMGYMCDEDDDGEACRTPTSFEQIIRITCNQDLSAEALSSLISESLEEYCSKNSDNSIFVVETTDGELLSGFVDGDEPLKYFTANTASKIAESIEKILEQLQTEKCEGLDNECESFIQISPITDSDIRDYEHSSWTDSEEEEKFFGILDSAIAKLKDFSESSESNDGNYYADKVEHFNEVKKNIREHLSDLREFQANFTEILIQKGIDPNTSPSDDYNSDDFKIEIKDMKIKLNTSKLQVKEKLELNTLLDELESSNQILIKKLNEEGIYYGFEHEEEKHELIVADDESESEDTLAFRTNFQQDDAYFLFDESGSMEDEVGYSASERLELFDALENILDDLLSGTSKNTQTTTTERESTTFNEFGLETETSSSTVGDGGFSSEFSAYDKTRRQILEMFGNEDLSNSDSETSTGGYFFDDIKISAKSVIPQKSGANSYYTVKDIVHNKRGGTSQVQCDEGDILKGGGFSRGSGPIIGTSIPNSYSGAWGVIGQGPHSAYAICLDVPPKREKSQTLESEFDTLAELRKSLGTISDDESDTTTIDPTKITKAKDIIDELRDSASSSTIAGRINPSELWKLKEINEQFVQTDELREKIATLQSEKILDISDPIFTDSIDETERQITITKKTELDLTTAAQYDLIFDQSVVDTFDGLEQTESIDINPDEKYLDERLAELAELHDDIDIDELRQDVLDKKGIHVIEEQIVIKKTLFVPENLALDPSEFLLTKQSIQNEVDYGDYLSIYAAGDGSSPSGAESTSSDSSSGVTKSTGARITTSAEYSHTFLNGFTLGNNYEWSWNKKWETKRGFEIAYVGISAELTYGFGLRVPFEITATIDDDEHSPSDKDDTYFNVDYTVDTLNLTGEQMGDLGLPKSKQFDGKEFVLEFGAQADLVVRLLEKTIVDKQIGDIIDEGEQFETPLGSKTAEIADIEIDGNLIGLVYTTGILKIMLDVGLIVDLGSDGIVMDVSPINSSGGGEITFTSDGETISEEYKVKTVHFFSGDADYVEFGTILDDVEYLPEVLLTPKTRLTGVIETGVFGEYTISTPWIEVYTFEIDLPALGTHDGTVGELEVGTGKMYKTFKMGYGPDEFIGKPSSTPSSFSPTK